jgi:flagellar export protein FliJ
MTAAKKTVARAAKIWNHRQEVVALQMQRISEALQREDEDLRRLKGELEGMLKAFEAEGARTSFLDAADLSDFFQGAFRMIREEERKKRTIRRLKEEWKARREVWEDIYRRKKALDILEKRLEQEETLSVLRAEQKVMDDLALIRRERQ